MDKALANALKKKEELEKKLADIERFLEMYREFAGTKPENDDTKPVDETEEDEEEDEDEGEGEDDGQRSGPKAVAQMSAGILKDLRRPLSRGELVVELLKRGVTLPGADKVARARYVGTVMWRNPHRFENIEGRGYWLKGIALPKTDEFDLGGKSGS